MLMGWSLLLAGFASAPATAQPDLTQKAGATVADAPSSIYRFEQWQLDAADGERHYRVQMAVPRRAPPSSGYPVLYLLDGNAAFAALTAAQLQALDESGSPPVLVAIGYQTELRFDTTARAYDYTPPLPGEAPTMDNATSGRRGGGADIFFALIEQRIKPAVRARAAVNPARQSLWGHSYGGLFVLHTLLRHPTAFQRYIAADPSFWWQGGYILQEEQQAPPVGEGSCLLVMTGGGVSAGGTPPARPGMDAATAQRGRNERGAMPPETAAQFVARQGQRTGLTAALRQFPGVSHGAMLGLSLEPALQWVTSARCSEK